MKSRGILLAVFLSLGAKANAGDCTVTVWTSPTVLSQATFGPNYYGPPPWSANQAYSSTTVMQWGNPIQRWVPAGNRSFYITGGTFAYFLVSYRLSECGTHFGVSRKQSEYMGTYTKGNDPDGYYRLYALKDDQMEYNLSVNLTGKMLIERQ